MSPNDSVMPEQGVPGGPLGPQYFADKLTLFQPRGAHSAHPLQPAPPKIFTSRHHWTQFGLDQFFALFSFPVHCRWADLCPVLCHEAAAMH